MTIQKGVLTISKELFCQRPFGQTLYNQKADGLMTIISSRSPSLFFHAAGVVDACTLWEHCAYVAT